MGNGAYPERTGGGSYHKMTAELSGIHLIVQYDNVTVRCAQFSRFMVYASVN